MGVIKLTEIPVLETPGVETDIIAAHLHTGEVEGVETSELILQKVNVEDLSLLIKQLQDLVNKTQMDTAIGAVTNSLADAEDSLEQLEQQSSELSTIVSGKVDGAYVESGYLYLTSNDVVVAGPLGPFSGGGGGSISGAVMSASNTTGWLTKTVSSNAEVNITATWSSVEDEVETGNGTVTIINNGINRASIDVAQGEISVNIKPYLNAGNNLIKFRIADVYGNSRTFNFTITVVQISLSSSFDYTAAYSGAITFPFTPVGSVSKTVHFILDGTDIGTVSTTASGKQLTYTIPAQAHGAHTLRVYFDADINEESVRSNELYYEFIVKGLDNNTPVIVSQFHDFDQQQYSSVVIPFIVYNPASLTAEVKIYAGSTLLSTQTVDRTEQSYTYRADTAGTIILRFVSGSVTKTIELNVVSLNIDVSAETNDLALYLSAQGRSNQEEHPDTWVFGEGANAIEAEFDDFTWDADGWQTDEDGIAVMRVTGNARLTIPYQPFAEDFRTSGKTIELEFATRNVLDYDATILSCMSGNRGLSLTAQKAMLKSEQSEISTQYKEDDHIRVAFVAEKRTENRLLLVYINGIPSGVVQYPVDDDFSQITPVDITVGSNDCTIDLYCIRVYDNDLSRNQVLNNWIADTQIGSVMLERYQHNDVYDDYGSIVISKLPSDLPYMILEAEQLPQYKGDKKTISGSYTDPMNSANSFEFTGCQINVQGTSSAPYARKNYDLQFKNGFEMASGTQANFALSDDVVPFNRFVLKADVASSEGANNVELVKLFCDINPFRSREELNNPKVRQGIYGFPIVVFWHDTTTGITSFLGKYNFNLPKRAPEPYGYTGTMESWEFQNNTSDLMLFKSNDFESMYTDPETGDVYPAWKNDFEARFPSDEWEDIRKIKELVTFVLSTDRDRATGYTLSNAVTYDGVTYTEDTAAYRLARFRNEFGSYADVDSFVFYYIFTELFLMVDSRAKNLFIGFNGADVSAAGRYADRKAVAQPYDMDTGLGTNNEGSLVFGYGLEDTDHLTGGANVFNGQNSVLWCNVRDAFRTEIVRMYQNLRSGGVLSYSSVEQRYEDHQSKWPEAVWIEDAWFKYIDPLINPDPGKEPTAVYLPMMQGSKAEQRKWWLSNRFKYMDSKWNAGDALSQVIQLRGYAKDDITITPYADIYPTVKYASYLVQERGVHGQATTIACPLDSVNDTEIYIYSAPQLASVGDLSGLKVGFADFSMGTRLQSIKVGDSSSSYENQNLTNLTLGSNRLLRTLDARNCVALGTGDQKTVDLSGCEIIEEIYFEGTQIQGVTLPRGGVLNTLHLPETVTNLTIINQKLLDDLVIPTYDNLTTLRLENVPEIDTKEIINEIPSGVRVRLIGFEWEADDDDEIEELLDIFDTMRGLDEQGGNMEVAQISGTIHTYSLTGEQIASYNARYPYLRVNADHTTSYLKYASYDGTTILKTVECIDGVPQDTAPSGPSRTSTAQYSYEFCGWSKTMDSTTADADAATDVAADRTIYAAYTPTVRKYTVTWKNTDNTTLETDYNVPYGTVPTYDGTTPTYQGQTSTGWTPTVTAVTGDTTYKAVYIPIYTVRFFNDETLLETVYVLEGSDATYSGTTPTSTDGEFLGWTPEPTNVSANLDVFAMFNIEIVEPDLKYLNYTKYDDSMTITVRGLNTAAIIADNLAFITIPDTIDGYQVVLA